MSCMAVIFLQLSGLLKGYFRCFVLYLKIINTFLKNNVCILKKIVQETQKWH